MATPTSVTLIYGNRFLYCSIARFSSRIPLRSLPPYSQRMSAISELLACSPSAMPRQRIISLSPYQPTAPIILAKLLADKRSTLSCNHAFVALRSEPSRCFRRLKGVDVQSALALASVAIKFSSCACLISYIGDPCSGRGSNEGESTVISVSVIFYAFITRYSYRRFPR